MCLNAFRHIFTDLCRPTATVLVQALDIGVRRVITEKTPKKIIQFYLMPKKALNRHCKKVPFEVNILLYSRVNISALQSTANHSINLVNKDLAASPTGHFFCVSKDPLILLWYIELKLMKGFHVTFFFCIL